MMNAKAFLLAMMLAAAPVYGMAEGTMLGIQVKDTPAPTMEAVVSPTPKVEEAAPQGLFDPITKSEIEASGLGTRIIWRGMEGEDVALMQRRLYQLGYYLGEIDGIFGLGTSRAV